MQLKDISEVAQFIQGNLTSIDVIPAYVYIKRKHENCVS